MSIYIFHSPKIFFIPSLSCFSFLPFSDHFLGQPNTLKSHQTRLNQQHPIFLLSPQARRHLLLYQVISPVFSQTDSPHNHLHPHPTISHTSIHLAMFNDCGYSKLVAPPFRGLIWGGDHSVTRGYALRAHAGLYSVAHPGRLIRHHAIDTPPYIFLRHISYP